MDAAHTYRTPSGITFTSKRRNLGFATVTASGQVISSHVQRIGATRNADRRNGLIAEWRVADPSAEIASWEPTTVVALTLV